MTGEDHEALQVNATASAFRFHPRPDRQPLSRSPATTFHPPTIANCEQQPCKHGPKSRAFTPHEAGLTIVILFSER
jgi:hypothetical protein